MKSSNEYTGTLLWMPSGTTSFQTTRALSLGRFFSMARNFSSCFMPSQTTTPESECLAMNSQALGLLVV